MVTIIMLVAITVVETQPHAYNNHYYVLSGERDYWQNAKPACERQGGYLVSINEDGERDFLYDLYDQLNPPTNIWIGLSGRCYSTTRRCDTFVWEDGNPRNSFNWHSDYPTTGRYSNYVQIDKGTMQWKNVRSSIGRGITGDKRFYICEFVGSCFIPSNPCQNGGLCSAIERWRGYECNCTNTGYVGMHCEVEVDECESNPCVHGLCNDGLQRYTCVCQGSGYTGPQCETDTNECASQPCVHGVCIDDVNHYRCDCNGSGFDGDLCEIDVNECASYPCVHGNCIDARDGYRCDCDGSGFTGDLCEIDINDCVSDPCVHGNCVDGSNAFTCDCTDSGYTGTSCDQDVDECLQNTHDCRHGICENSDGSFRCRCLSGISGRLCSEDVDECLQADACNFHGNCTNKFGFYNCSCFNGFSGETCQHKTQPANRDDTEDTKRSFGYNSYKIGFIVCICLLIPFIAASVVLFYLWRRRTTPIHEDPVIKPESFTGLSQKRSKPVLDPADVRLELGGTRYQYDTSHFLSCGDTGTGELLEKLQYEQLQARPTDTYEIHDAEPYIELSAVGNMPGVDIKTVQ